MKLHSGACVLILGSLCLGQDTLSFKDTLEQMPRGEARYFVTSIAEPAHSFLVWYSDVAPSFLEIHVFEDTIRIVYDMWGGPAVPPEDVPPPLPAAQAERAERVIAFVLEHKDIERRQLRRVQYNDYFRQLKVWELVPIQAPAALADRAYDATASTFKLSADGRRLLGLSCGAATSPPTPRTRATSRCGSTSTGSRSTSCAVSGRSTSTRSSRIPTSAASSRDCWRCAGRTAPSRLRWKTTASASY